MKDPQDKLDLALREAYQLAQQLTPLPVPGAADPDDELLLRLLDDAPRLDPGEADQLRAQVDAAPFCRERLATLTEALAELRDAPPADESPINRLTTAGKSETSPVRISFHWARGCLRYLWGTLEPRSLVAVPVATRGQAATAEPQEETSFFDFAHQLDGLDVVIQVERATEDLLDVQLSFDGDAQRLAHLRVTLADEAGTLLDSQPVEQGQTRFAALQPSPHELQITSAQQELGRVRLDILPG
jgi:hypothetical protein